MRSMDDFHTNSWGTEMHVVAGRDVVEINCYPLGGVAKGQIVIMLLNYIYWMTKLGKLGMSSLPI